MSFALVATKVVDPHTMGLHEIETKPFFRAGNALEKRTHRVLIRPRTTRLGR